MGKYSDIALKTYEAMQMRRDHKEINEKYNFKNKGIDADCHMFDNMDKVKKFNRIRGYR